jgi:hypothetical protein
MSDQLSRPAAESLMMIHTRESVPYLVKLLGCADPYVQDAAIRGLSLFVRGAPVITGANLPSMPYLVEGELNEFSDDAISPYVTIIRVPGERTNEYVGAWSAWWGRMSSKWSHKP